MYKPQILAGKTFKLRVDTWELLASRVEGHRCIEVIDFVEKHDRLVGRYCTMTVCILDNKRL